jgi:D-aminoacyl-tRNA deacylase
VKVLLQRVREASVTVGDEPVARIGRGLLVFVGVEPDDGDAQIARMAERIVTIRVFPDGQRPMNRSVADVDGELLVVSQFTLAADTSRGRRPGFSTAAPPDRAEAVYQALVARVRDAWPKVATGRFGTDMQVALVNDGPVTLFLET